MLKSGGTLRDIYKNTKQEVGLPFDKDSPTSSKSVAVEYCSAVLFMGLLLHGLMEYHALDGTLAYGAETLGRIISHATYVCRTVDTLSAVTATLVDAYRVVLRAIGSYGCRYLDAGLHHVGPLRIEVDKRCDVRLPRLVAERVHLVVVVATEVEVLVAQATKRVAKLVNNNGAEGGVVCGCESVGVVDAATTVCIRIGQDNKVLAWDVGREIVHSIYVRRG